MSMLRSRWAALGAAVAVSLGAGGIGLVQADLAAGERPVTVTVTPKRVLDTRTDLGLAGAFSHASPRDVQITGSVPVATPSGPASDTVVPVGATGVVVNVTVVRPSARGFLSLRPAGATGTPTTSNLNFTAGSVVPNSATVDLGADGKLQVWVSLDPGSGSVHVLVDIVGYTIDHNHDDRYYTNVEVDDLLASIPAGPKGDTGAQGAPGADAESPARVIWVADDGTGDFTSLSAALDSITDNSVSKPYLIRIAPGVYTESAYVIAKSHVDIEGSGQGVTTITCACPTTQPTGPDAVLKLSGSVEIRQLTIENTGGGTYSQGVAVGTSGASRVSIRDVTVRATGGIDTNLGLVNPSSAELTNVSIEASGGSSTFGVYDEGGGSPTLMNVTVTASGATDANIGMYNNLASSPTLTDVTVTASGGTISRGLENVESSPSIRDSTIVATGSNGTGVYNIYTGTTGFGASPTIRGSVVTGSTNSIFTDLDSSVKVADTTLGGPRGGTGTYTCVGVHNSAFVALNATCS